MKSYPVNMFSITDAGNFVAGTSDLGWPADKHLDRFMIIGTNMNHIMEIKQVYKTHKVYRSTGPVPSFAHIFND